MAYMAKRSRSFRDIDDSAISTQWKGLSQIYDMVRKKAKKMLDEKPASI